ncbi:MAG: 3' terminal RNA ribose 2'-O-methyltransferase Hen1 [Fimbriimonadaceae bacterium]|nr:3' terminal RNA ribose 2'-O-methyltransferase Hen1 [Fimbriimonadaceae bacterium]
MGASPYFSVTLRYTGLLKDMLAHLYVLIPVLDNSKHYFIADDEVEKLMRRAESWLPSHPSKEAIVSRYLQKRRVLTRLALQQLAETEDPDEQLQEAQAAEEEAEKKISLHEIRLETVRQRLLDLGVKRVVDLGCGEGRLLKMILKEKQLSEVVGMDVSDYALSRAEKSLRIHQLPAKHREKLKIIHGSLMYRDPRIEGFDAATVVEVIEHMDPPRLAAFQRNVFEFARPTYVLVTTPNREYNALFPGLEEGKMRHRDHRFEWTREEFKAWCDSVCERFGYSVEIRGIGPEDENAGAPSQMGVFAR